MFWQIATLIAVYADWGFAQIKGIGWDWAGVIWLYSIVFFIPLDLFKIFIRYVLSGKAWDNLPQRKVKLLYKLITTVKIVLSLSVALKILICLHHCRLPSLQRRIMAEKKGKPSGLQHREHFTDFSPLKTPTSSLTRAAIASCQRLQSKPCGELKLQG